MATLGIAIETNKAHKLKPKVAMLGIAVETNKAHSLRTPMLRMAIENNYAKPLKPVGIIYPVLKQAKSTEVVGSLIPVSLHTPGLVNTTESSEAVYKRVLKIIQNDISVAEDLNAVGGSTPGPDVIADTPKASETIDIYVQDYFSENYVEPGYSGQKYTI